MRLRCEVRAVIRTAETGAQGAQGAGAPTGVFRPVVSTLALSSSPSAPASSFLLHFCAAHKNGKRYKLNGNVTQVFVRFCNEGKATIQFKEPPCNLFIQSDPVQLKAFLRILKLCLEGKVDSSELSSLTVVPKNTAPTKLTVSNVSEIPMKGLPRTLHTLQMSGLQMCLFKREILMLRSLRSLNLSNNRIEKLPPEVGNMPCLVELFLNDNLLGSASDWRWIEGLQITNKLKLLDLSLNQLFGVPNTVSKLKSLVTLKLDSNNLKCLPKGIGTMKTLRFLSTSKNNLSVLPANLLCLRLEKADFSLNPLSDECLTSNTNIGFKMSSLVEQSSAAVLKYKIFYTKNLIPYTLVDYLDNSNYCACGKPTFDSHNYATTIFSLKSFCEAIVCDGKYNVNFGCYLCSHKCHKKFISDRRFR